MPGGTKPPVGPLAHEVVGIIRGHLARIGWTHGKLGAKIGISASQVSRMLRGDRHMDLDQLARICQVTGLRVTDVLAEAERALAARDAAEVEARQLVAELGTPGEGDEGQETA
jgi:transcriptional regulator with XRE-family HTH domain